jgi:transposase
MKHLHAKSHHTDDEIRDKITSIKSYNDVIDWKIVQCIKSNASIKAEDISRVLGVSIAKIYTVIQSYNKSGREYKVGKHWGGRREERSYLTLEEETQILEKLSLKARKGLILTAKDIKKAFEDKIGHEVSDDYLWDVLNRHNWNKKTPRPEHPKTNITKQEEFKKNFQKVWRPAD